MCVLCCVLLCRLVCTTVGGRSANSYVACELLPLFAWHGMQCMLPVLACLVVPVRARVARRMFPGTWCGNLGSAACKWYAHHMCHFTDAELALLPHGFLRGSSKEYVKAAEQNGWRAEGQAGFRPKKSTVDQVFILRHLIESTQLGGGNQELFCCFVDFRKAYDSVRRDLLLKRLAELGVHGSMLRTLASMYWSAPLVPKLGDKLGQSIDSTCGVKQGDPLSPLLFGLFIDELEGFMKDQVGVAAGVQLGLLRLYLLLYADDLVLLSRSREGLQQQLQALEAFCGAKGMEVNLSKTEAVVFRPAGTAFQQDWHWQCKGAPVPISQEFRYLGIIFHDEGCVCSRRGIVQCS